MTRDLAIKLVGEAIDVTLDASCYTLEVARRAAIKFTDLASFEFASDAGTIRIRIEMFDDAGMPASKLAQVFKNELLDQCLRAVIFNETATERNLILAHAFSRSRLVTPR